MNELKSTPQIFIMGCIKEAFGFDCNRLYAKYEIKTGGSWKLMSGEKKGETFDCYSSEDFVPLEQPFECHFTCRTIKGWPKLLLEVWGIDKHQRNKIEGYGVAFIPPIAGFHTIKVTCWRPEGSWTDDLCGTHPELKYPDLIVSSQQRNNMRGVSSGYVNVQVSVVTKDFNLHGVLFAPSNN